LDLALAFFVYLALGSGTFLVAGFLFRTSSSSIEPGMLRNSFPKHLITLLDNVGGLVLQQIQLFPAQELVLKPWCLTLSLSLLLTSELTRGTFDFFPLQVQSRGGNSLILLLEIRAGWGTRLSNPHDLKIIKLGEAAFNGC
jgi:hypothetical protein